MLNPVLYSRNNTAFTINDANYFLDNYLNLIKWRPKANILDVGTGEGSVLLQALLPRIPDFQRITASDISSDMLDVARQKLDDDAKISLLQLNIASRSIPEELRGSFDHIFSFYCLHMVKDQRQTFRNFFDFLKPGGDMLLTVVAKHLAFDVYEKLAQMDRWKAVMVDFRDVGFYHHSCNSRGDMKGFLRCAGFEEHKCELIKRRYTHRLSEFWPWASGVNPFINRIAENDLDAYKEDYMKEVRENKSVIIEKKNGEELMHVEYQCLVVYARKSI